MKKWRVVLDAAKAPTCGDWVAVSGLCPGEDETARFLFLDGTEADGFTFLDASLEQVGNSILNLVVLYWTVHYGTLHCVSRWRTAATAL